MTYHFYLFAVKFPKFFNFSDSIEKSYQVEWNIFWKNATYSLQKIPLDNFLRNFYIWSANVSSACMQKIKIGHRAKFRAWNIFCRFYFRFARFYARFNFRCANFESFSWRVCLRALVQLKTLSSLLKLGNNIVAVYKMKIIFQKMK